MKLDLGSSLDSWRCDLRDNMWYRLGAILRADLGDNLLDSLWVGSWAGLLDSLGDSLWVSLGDSLLFRSLDGPDSGR